MLRLTRVVIFRWSSMRLEEAVILAAAMMTLFTLAQPALAQQLGDGDYEICSVYDRNEQFVGYDNVCLELQRAALRQLRGHNRDSYTGSMLCPWQANNGQGYNATFYSNGRSASLFGTWDSTWNGRPCVPRGRPFTRGYP